MGALTVQSFTVMKDKEDQVKKDKYGNTYMMIKFVENPETAFKSVKDPSTIVEGKVMYGTIEDGQYGPRFKADPFDQGTTPPSSPNPSPSQGLLAVTSNDELLELVKDNNRMLKLLVGDTEQADEPDFGG